MLNKFYDEGVPASLMQSSVITTRGHDFKLYKNDEIWFTEIFVDWKDSWFMELIVYLCW